MIKNTLKHLLALQLILGSAVAFATSATYNFTQITSNGNQLVASQLSAVVETSGSNVLFTFTNSAGIASSITDIYFDYTGLFSSVSNNILGAAGDSTGVSFSDGASPSNLSSGNTVGFTADASGDSNSGGPGVVANGVNASSEFVKFLGTTSFGITFADVLAGLDSGALRLGLHVQSIGGAGSEAFVNAVPLPAAGWLFGSALFGLMGLRRRKM